MALDTLHLCTTRDSFPVRVLMGILDVILSLLQVLLKVTICPLQVCVRVARDLASAARS